MIAASAQQPTTKITWSENKPCIETSRLNLTPIKREDLGFYQDLFQNATAMGQYLGSTRTPEQTAARFGIWLERWNKHSFSALKISDKDSGAQIGHVILGHGDFEDDIDIGFSEIAIVISPPFWNSRFKDLSKGIGTQNMEGIGTEVIKAIVAYAKELFNRKQLVPVDITEEQSLQVNITFDMGLIKNCIRNGKEEITAIHIPFRSIRATCLRANTAAHRIFQKVFVVENGGTCTSLKKDSSRDLFEIKF